MNDLINSIISDAEKEDYKRKFELENPNGLGMSVNVGGYGNLIFKDDSAFQQFQQNPQSMTFSQGPGGRRYVEPKAADFDTKFIQPPILTAPPRAAYNSMAFQDPNSPYSQTQQNAADAYGDIVRARLYNDRQSGRSQSEPFTRGMGNTSTGPLSNTYYSASSNALTNVANRPFTGENNPSDINVLRARKELGLRSDEGEYAIPGYGDQGQFFGGGILPYLQSK